MKSETQPFARATRKAVRRAQLLSTALELFCQFGYAGTSTKKIADAAGVTEGLLFHYFPTKADLLLAVGAREHTFAGRVLTLIQQADALTARALFHRIAEGLAQVSQEERAFIGFMTAESHVNEQLKAVLAQSNHVVFGQFVQALAKKEKSGELRKGQSLETVAVGFLGGFFFFLSQSRDLSQSAWQQRAGAFASEWAELCWRGIASNTR
jgi:AcrR family transcriptional regulator